MSISKVINYCAADTKDREVKEQINRSKKKKKRSILIQLVLTKMNGAQCRGHELFGYLWNLLSCMFFRN
jgi:hypothetical protein